ncbi:MAG: SGNH/GDSL hydrolase family protein [Rubrivivax sp.]|jgi:hypothetical protein
MVRRWLGNVAVVVTSVVAALVVAEFAIPHIITLRNVGASFTVYDPVVWNRLKPNFETVRVTPDFTMRFSTNSLGARGAEPSGPVKQPVLFLGDSFTMGYGVSDGQEYPALLGQKLGLRHGTQAPLMLNLGMGASGNGFWLKHLQTTAVAVQPRLVVLQVLQNDFWDNTVEGLYRLDEKGELVELPVPPPRFARRVQTVVESIPGLANSNLMGLVRQAMSNDPGFSIAGRPTQPGAAASAPAPQRLEPGDTLTLKLVEAALRKCQAERWPVILLSVGLQAPQRAAIRQVAEQVGTPLLELPSRTERPDLYFKIDGHWNAQGHVEAAEALLQRIDALQLLPLQVKSSP